MKYKKIFSIIILFLISGITVMTVYAENDYSMDNQQYTQIIDNDLESVRETEAQNETESMTEQETRKVSEIIEEPESWHTEETRKIMEAGKESKTLKVTETEDESETESESETETETEPEPVKDISASIRYSTHVQSIGTQNYVYNGATAGTTGRSLRLEGITINVDTELSGDIQYSTHVQSYGWMNYVGKGRYSGTTGKYLRMEAIKIRLTGELEQYYDIYYRVHVQSFGWLGWAKNNEIAGTTGLGARMEAIQIILIKKEETGRKASLNTYRHYITEVNNSYLSYTSHIQSIGTQAYVSGNAISGTTGKALRIEGIQARLNTSEQTPLGKITYSVKGINYGWTGNVSDGGYCGTMGKYQPIEQMKISISGEIERYYDIYYRVHVQSFGWLGWAKNGQATGTQGYNRRIEAYQVKLVRKGTLAPNNSGYFKKSPIIKLSGIQKVLQNPELPTGCESVALTIALKYYGFNLSKTTIADNYLPYSTDFYVGFWGNPHTRYGYGCYAPAITTAAANYLKANNSKLKAYNISGTQLSNLYSYIDEGYPVIVWGSMYMVNLYRSSAYSYHNGEKIYWINNEHCMVLYGYDKTNDLLYISDPLEGLVVRKRAQFESLYNTLGKMAVVIK